MPIRRYPVSDLGFQFRWGELVRIRPEELGDVSFPGGSFVPALSETDTLDQSLDVEWVGEESCIDEWRVEGVGGAELY